MHTAIPSIAAQSTNVSLSSPAAAESGLINPNAVQFNAATGKVYTVDTSSNQISIVDDAANKTLRVSVGDGPVSLGVNSHTGQVYVVNAADSTVSVIDGYTDAVTATVAVGIHPYSIAVNSSTGKVYISHTFNDQLTIIDGATNITSSIKTGSADLISIDTRRNLIYLLGYEGGKLKVLDGATLTATEQSVGMHAWGMALNETDGTLDIAKPGSAQLAILSSPSSPPIMAPTGAIPCAVALNEQTNRIYVVNYADNTVTVLDGSEGRAIATIPVGERPQAVTVDTAANHIYVANTQSNSVTAIDGRNNRVIGTLAAGKKPYALVVNPRSGRLHVANFDKVSSTVIDLHDISNVELKR